jgi:hypothetical protein|tara:strand:+ start:737 stop:1054 length:318 start_codon:yes stop_codon:yes gene_type:complete
MINEILGKEVLIRTYSAGVHYGILDKAESVNDSYDVKLKNATRVYSWAGACSLSQLATEGTKNTETKLSVTVPTIFLKAIEVIEMTPLALERLADIKTWKIDNND